MNTFLRLCMLFFSVLIISACEKEGKTGGVVDKSYKAPTVINSKEIINYG